MFPSEFFKFLKDYRDKGINPPSYAWPQSIEFGKQFWDPIKSIYKNTLKDNYEYETSFFYADGTIVNSIPKRGGKTSVVSNHSLKVAYEPKDNTYYSKKILLDDRVAYHASVKVGNLPKQIEAGFLFNIHTHPAYYFDKTTGSVVDTQKYLELNRLEGLFNKLKSIFSNPNTILDQDPNLIKTYGFFSDTDINSLLSSSMLISGLATNEFWLVGKTDKAIKQIGENGVEMLYKISHQAYSGDKFLEDIIKQEMVNWGLVFYRARIGGRIRRIL